MTILFRNIAVACIALSLGACGSDNVPEGTKTDTALAAVDTIAALADTSTEPSGTTSTAVVDSAGASAAATTEPVKTTTATKEVTPTPSAEPTRTTDPAPPKTKPTPPSTPTPTPPPTPTPRPPPTPTPTPPAPDPPPETADKGSNDPKSIFRNEKCGACHTVTAQGINGDGEIGGDLSTVGTRRSSDWIIRFLNKQEMIDGKKHKKGWKGSDEDQKTIARWLSGLR